jgi:hypothetical protein
MEVIDTGRVTSQHTKMTKTERLEWLKKRHEQFEETTDAVLPFHRRDVEEEASLMESVLEERRDRQSNGGLTSDE